MREPDRIHRIIDKLMQYWALHPELRLGQIVVNSHRDSTYLTPFHMEDDEFEAWLTKELDIAKGGYETGNSFVFRDKDRMVTKDELYED